MTDYDVLLPKQILFSIKELDELGIIKSDMCRKLILNRKIEYTKVGNKNHISRQQVLEYLQNNTYTVSLQKIA